MSQKHIAAVAKALQAFTVRLEAFCVGATTDGSVVTLSALLAQSRHSGIGMYGADNHTAEYSAVVGQSGLA